MICDEPAIVSARVITGEQAVAPETAEAVVNRPDATAKSSALRWEAAAALRAAESRLPGVAGRLVRAAACRAGGRAAAGK